MGTTLKKKVDLEGVGVLSRADLRVEALKRVEAGISPEVVVRDLGISRQTIYTWINRYRSGGYAGLISDKRRTLKFDVPQLRELDSIIQRKSPSDFGFDSSLWSALILKELITKVFGVSLNVLVVRGLMKEMGYSDLHPLRWTLQSSSVLSARSSRFLEALSRIKPQVKRSGRPLYFLVRHSGVRASGRWTSALVPQVPEWILTSAGIHGFRFRCLGKKDIKHRLVFLLRAIAKEHEDGFAFLAQRDVDVKSAVEAFDPKSDRIDFSQF